MINRTTPYFASADNLDIQQTQEHYWDTMTQWADEGDFKNALGINNLIYMGAFNLYLKGVSREFQIARMEKLIEIANEYLEQINQNPNLR